LDEPGPDAEVDQALVGERDDADVGRPADVELQAQAERNRPTRVDDARIDGEPRPAERVDGMDRVADDGLEVDHPVRGGVDADADGNGDGGLIRDRGGALGSGGMIEMEGNEGQSDADVTTNHTRR